MKNILSYLIPATLSLLIATNVGSQDLKLKATDKLLSLKDKKINSLSNQVTSGINSYVNNLGGVSAGDSLGGLKYIDFDLKLQDCLLYTSPSPRDVEESADAGCA